MLVDLGGYAKNPSLNTHWPAQNQWRLAIVVWTIDAEPGTIVALNDLAIAIRWDETEI